MNSPELTLRPIGLIHTAFRDRCRAPRQGSIGTACNEGRIVLFPGRNFEQAVQDLHGFEKIWIIYWFHRNTAWKPKVLPPRGPRVRRGVFATRSPHRPNPLGLTAAGLVDVQGRELRVKGIDLLDGTPILDIKPYLPYADAFPQARTGWLQAVEERERARPPFRVEWSALAAVQARFLREEFGIDLSTPAESVLQTDPAPRPCRRIAARAPGLWELAIKSWRVRFGAESSVVRIESLASGYTPQALAETAPARPLHDPAAHAAFHARWPEA